MTRQKEVITAQDNVIKTKYAEVAKHKEQNNDSQLKIKELDHNISKHKREAEDAATKVCINSRLLCNIILRFYSYVNRFSAMLIFTKWRIFCFYV